MKIVCQKAVLAKAVNLAQNAVSTKSTLPILGNLLFETNAKGVEILGTDLEIGLRCQAEVEVVKQGSVTIPAKKLSDIIREIPDQEIELSAEEGAKVLIKSGKSQFKIMGLSRQDYPNLPEFKNDKSVEVSEKTLLEMIRKVIFSVSSDETRYVLNGALLLIDGKEIKMVSTDGHRLSFVKKGLNKSKDKLMAILPTKALTELLKILEESDEMIKIFFSDNHLFFQKGSTILVTRLIDGQFPNYEQVIPKKHENSLVAETDSILKATRRVALMASDKSNSVKYTLGKDLLTIVSNTPDVGEAEEEIEVSYSGPAMTVAYNARYVLDVLKVIDAPKTEIKLSSPLNPGLVVPHGDSGDHQYVIMPMRI